jgi:membrane protein DedA with SNARE-associated domain
MPGRGVSRERRRVGRHDGIAACLGVLVPSQALAVFGGVLAASGRLTLSTLIGLARIGAVLGGNLGYELCRHFGRPWLLPYGR